MLAIIFIGFEGSHTKDGKKEKAWSQQKHELPPVRRIIKMTPLSNQLGKRFFIPSATGCCPLAPGGQGSEVGPLDRVTLGQGTFPMALLRLSHHNAKTLFKKLTSNEDE